MTKKQHVFFHKIATKAPVGILFALIAYIYAVYMTTYLGKLLTNSYPYDSRTIPFDQTPSSQPIFLAIRTIHYQTNNFVSLLQSEEIGLSFQEQKGAIYFIVLHTLLLLLLVSVYRTIYTGPGRVSKDWNLKAEEELRRAIKAEKEMLKKQWLLKKYGLKRNELSDLQTIVVDVEGSIRVENQPKLELEQNKQNSDLEELCERSAKVKSTDQSDQSEETYLQIELMESPNFFEELNQIAFFNAMKREKKRFCAHCQMFKPQRAHHCRQCNICVLKMDHHCPWVNNCIGLKNYKFFLNMLFYKVSTLWLIVFTYSESVSNMIYDLQVDVWTVFIACLTYFMVCFLAVLVTCFFIFHLCLVVTGMTTLELFERKQKKYNRNIWNNLQTVFGKNILFWCCPTIKSLGPLVEGEGLELTVKTIGNL